MNLLTDEVKKVFESRKNIPNTQSNEIRNSYNKNNVNNNYNNNDENLARFVNKKTPLKSKNRNNQIFQNLNDYSNYLSNNIDLNKSYNNYNRKNNSNGKNIKSKLNQSYRPATTNSKRKITLSNNLSINDTNDNTNVDFYKKPNTYFTQNNYSSQRKNTISTNKSNYPISILINNKKNDNLNYGERLYHKCKKIEERKNNKIQQIKNEEEKKLNRECTFKPRINRLSYHAFTNRYNNNLKYDDEDNIIYYRDYIDRKLNYLKERYNKKDENCYFSPKINKTKEKDNKSIPRYEQLYQNSKQLKSKKEFLDKIYNNNSFKPSINKVYNTEITNLPFNERQNIYNSRTTERKKQMKNQMENNIDSKTGQKFFQPKINQNSHLIKRNNDTFNKLYSDHKKQSVKKQKYEKEIQERFSPLESFATEQSNEILTALNANNVETTFSEIKSNYGHDAFLLEQGQLNFILSKFLTANTVEDLMMVDIATIRENANLQDTAKLMLDKHVTHIPVVTDDNKLIGIVTSWDLSKSIATNSNHLKDIMTKTVKYCHADDTIEDIARKMRKYDISCLPVVDGDMTVKGLITTDQISNLLS